jgi:hypothetical protein
MSASSSAASATPPVVHASTTAINPPPYYNKNAAVPVYEASGMQYVRLGNTGVVVSRICLGLMSYAKLEKGYTWSGQQWVLNSDEGFKYVEQALEAGQ